MVMTSYGDLSDDMMVEILSRLPVKSLMRFRCVCKSWNDLVKDPNFIYKHLQKDDNIRLTVSCTYKNPYDTDPFNALISYSSVLPDKTLSDLHYQDFEPVMDGLHIGPFDGIFLLLRNDTNVILWNVSMNEYRVVPECTAHFPRNTTANSSNFGLGLDPATNDFKLVLILTLIDEERQEIDYSPVAVYNFTTNCWRDLGGFQKSYDYRFDSSHDAYLNGLFYWVVRRPDCYKEILTFSMSEEVFRVIEGPNIPQFLNYYESAMRPWMLGIYEECLSLLYSEDISHSFEVWMMKGGSWSKYLTFGPFVETYRARGFWRRGEFLLESSDKRLVLYDSIYQEMRDLGINGLWFSVKILKESLITVRKEDA
ncbi:hypothetical protein AB3S75_002276 [Citrus x aurantiifolia]